MVAGILRRVMGRVKRHQPHKSDELQEGDPGFDPDKGGGSVYPKFVVRSQLMHSASDVYQIHLKLPAACALRITVRALVIDT